MLNKKANQKSSSLLFICSLALGQVAIADSASSSMLDALSAEASHTDMSDKQPAKTEEPDVVTVDTPNLTASDELSDKITKQLQDLLGKADESDTEDTEKGLEKVVSTALIEGNNISDIKAAVVESLAKIAAEDKDISSEQVDKAKKVLTKITTTNEEKKSPISKKSLPKTVTVESGESLFRIALRVYGDGNMYLQLFEANKATIKHPDLLAVGQVINIPDID